MAHEEFGHCEIEHVAKQHEKHGQVTHDGRYHDKPHADTQPREAHDILAGVQRVRLRRTLHVYRTRKIKGILRCITGGLRTIKTTAFRVITSRIDVSQLYCHHHDVNLR